MKKPKDFQVLPEIKLADYRKIASEIKRKEIFVEEEEVENIIKQIQLSRAKISLKKGPAVKGDFVEIEYSCLEIKNGEKFQDAFILGKGFLIPGFEERLAEMEAGQEKNFSLEFRGKDLEFNVKMKAVKKIELPEINDSMAQALGKFKDLSALKNSIKDGLKQEKQIFETYKRRKAILDNIEKVSVVPIPEPLLERAKDRIKKSLIIQEIARKEGLEPKEEEIKNRINELVKNYAPEKAKDIDLVSLRSYTEGAIIEEKVFQFLENVQKPDNPKNH